MSALSYPSRKTEKEESLAAGACYAWPLHAVRARSISAGGLKATVKVIAVGGHEDLVS